MERHRRHEIRLGQELGPGPGQPAAEERRQIGPVGVLEGEQHRPAAGIVAQHRPGPVEDRRAGRQAAQSVCAAQLELEGKAAARATAAAPGIRLPASRPGRARPPRAPLRRRSRRSAAAGPGRAGRPGRRRSDARRACAMLPLMVRGRPLPFALASRIVPPCRNSPISPPRSTGGCCAAGATARRRGWRPMISCSAKLPTGLPTG